MPVESPWAAKNTKAREARTEDITQTNLWRARQHCDHYVRRFLEFDKHGITHPHCVELGIGDEKGASPIPWAIYHTLKRRFGENYTFTIVETNPNAATLLSSPIHGITEDFQDLFNQIRQPVFTPHRGLHEYPNVCLANMDVCDWVTEESKPIDFVHGYHLFYQFASRSFLYFLNALREKLSPAGVLSMDLDDLPDGVTLLDIAAQGYAISPQERDLDALTLFPYQRISALRGASTNEYLQLISDRFFQIHDAASQQEYIAGQKITGTFYNLISASYSYQEKILQLLGMM